MSENTKKYRPDYALVMLSLVQVWVLFSGNFIFTAKSRVGARIGVSTQGVFGSLYIYFVLVVIVEFIFMLLYFRNRKAFAIPASLLEALSLCFVMFISATYANGLIEQGEKLRISLSVGFYVYLFVCYFKMIKYNDEVGAKVFKILSILLPFAFIAVLLSMGFLDNLSVVVEYNNKKQQFNTEMLKHFLMSLSVVITGVLVGVPLGLLSYRKPRVGRALNTFLNTAESIPAMALISLLMIPLAFLNNNFEFIKQMGISGIGASPVFIALTLYALYHIVSTTYGGLTSIEKSYIMISEGMGMTNRQICWKVQLPMILPTLISGVRVAAVSTIIGVTIGSYVGFGGLGMFVLQGANGFAIDIIILVTIPILIVVYSTDFLLKKVVVIVQRNRVVRGAVSYD